MVLLLEEPRLWPIWDRWVTGARREITDANYGAMPNFEAECLITLSQAQCREDERALRDRISRSRGDADGEPDSED